jgi:SagB-type dehydrogenase family enzyme
LRAPGTKRGRRAPPSTVSARLADRVTLRPHASGEIIAYFDGYSVGLGVFSAAVADRAHDLRAGLPLASFESSRRKVDKEIDSLVRRLAGHGLLQYRLGRSPDEDEVVIEPQVTDYCPRMPKLGEADVVVLSRFAYMRRRGNEIVLESPRAGALFKICNPKIAAVIAMLATPRQVRDLRRQDGFPGVELLALLMDCQIVLKADVSAGRGARLAEDEGSLVLWDFHDLLFHTRSTEGRHANPLGGTYLHAGVLPPPPAVRSRWPGKKIDLRKSRAPRSRALSPLAKLMHERHSTRVFNIQRPVTLAELARFLDNTARVVSTWSARVEDAGPVVTYTARPYPSAGASYELELYLAVDRCEGLPRGFYHYDAGEHALAAIAARPHELQALLTGAALAMGVSAVPQILITIAARFGRVSWKYSSLAYGLILKDVGVLTQTFYLMAQEMGLGGCAIGTTNIDLFAKMTGIEFDSEGPVGQFALGRAAQSGASD